MGIWTLIASVYLVPGIIFVFIGPAARQRRIEAERLNQELPDQPRWKLKAFGAAISAGIIMFWPALVVSAARKERVLPIRRTDVQSALPSVELSSAILQIRRQFSDGLLPFQFYRSKRHELVWMDSDEFDKQLESLGYVVTGLAKKSSGQDVPVAMLAASTAVPFELTELVKTVELSVERQAGTSKTAEQRWVETFKIAQATGDEVWKFSTCRESWQALAGRAGLALVRNGTVIDLEVTMMN